MTEPFAGVVGPLFQHVVDLLGRIDRGEAGTLDDERRGILAAIDEADRKASGLAQVVQNYQLSRHAIIYWIDEVLTDSRWAHAGEWRQRILEWDFYRDRIRADAFYERLDRAERLDSVDPLEAFLLCLTLGFRGRLADDPDELRRVVGRVYGRVAAASGQPDRFLADEAPRGGPIRPLPGKSTLLAVSILVSLSVLFTLACFVLAVPPPLWD
jgi:type VI secretion system protein ImpK